jgi:4-amino-4-deoxy-L-arabinose transferase-like glycosyltransferase
MQTSTARKPATPQRHQRADRARIRRLLLGAVAVIGPVILLVYYYCMLFPGLTNPDALDLAQVGRNLASGKGFTTFLLRPLALTHGHNPLAQPDVVHGPLFSFCLAIAFNAFGARDNVAAGVSGLFFLLTIPVIYRLGKRLYGERAGTVAALVFTLSALSLEYATSGLHLTLGIFLITSLLLTAYSVATYARESVGGAAATLPKATLALTGALTALLYLTDPLFFWVIPATGITLLRLLRRQQRGLAAVWLFLPVMLLAAPWMVRNGILTGNPIFGLRGAELWMNTRHNFPGMSAYRMLPAEVRPQPGVYDDILRKVALGIGTVLSTWPSVSGNWMLVFFLPSLLFPSGDAAANAVRRVLVSCFLTVACGMLFFQIQMPILVTFVPGMLIFAVGYLMSLVRLAKLSPGVAQRLTALLTVVLLYPLFSALALVDKPAGIPERNAALILAKLTRPDEVVLSDQPWTVAWYTDHPVVLVPYTETNVADIRQQFPGVRWLFLSQAVTASGREWRGLYQSLLQWNVAYADAKTGNQTPPSAVRITGTAPPLVAALNGFVTCPPVETGTPTIVVAFAPPEQSARAVVPAGARISSR